MKHCWRKWRGAGYVIARRTIQADTVKSSPTTSHQGGFFPDGIWNWSWWWSSAQNTLGVCDLWMLLDLPTPWTMMQIIISFLLQVYAIKSWTSTQQKRDSPSMSLFLPKTTSPEPMSRTINQAVLFREKACSTSSMQRQKDTPTGWTCGVEQWNQTLLVYLMVIICSGQQQNCGLINRRKLPRKNKPGEDF